MSDQSAPNPAFPIDRKVWTSQIAMLATVLTFVIVTATSKLLEVDIPDAVQLAIMGLLVSTIGGAVGWLTPASRSDIVSKLDNSLVAEAQADPASPVNLSAIIDDKMILQAQLDPASPATIPEGETRESLTDKLAYSP
jgi:hypothetical protein